MYETLSFITDLSAPPIPDELYNCPKQYGRRHEYGDDE